MEKILQFKASLSGHKSFVREYELRSDMKLYALHEFISEDLDFTKDQMVLFRGLKNGDEIAGEYGLFDFGCGSLDTVRIKEVLERGEVTLFYVFDLHKNRYIRLDFSGEVELVPRKYYPRCTFSKGLNPSQFSDLYDDIEDPDIKNIPLPDDPDDDYLEESDEIDEQDVFQ